jgi:transcriptional regulator with XRE-family HTH domain
VSAAAAEGPVRTGLPASAKGNPTIPRILLGARLRRLRTDAGISREDAGYAIRGSESKISRMELGRVGFKPRDVADLLTLYGVRESADREMLLALADQANAQSWWHAFSEVVPPWFEAYLGMEDAASVIRCYHTRLVPGLLQTEDYARAVIGSGNPLARADEIDRRVALRMRRARLLHRPHPPKLWAILDEAVLRRPPGSHDTMQAQIEHMLELSRLPHVTIQIVPFHRGGYADAGTHRFTLLRFAEAALGDIVYLEHLTGATFLDKTDDLDAYTKVMDQLCLDALPAAGSTDFLVDMVKEM